MTNAYWRRFYLTMPLHLEFYFIYGNISTFDTNDHILEFIKFKQPYFKIQTRYHIKIFRIFIIYQCLLCDGKASRL